MNNDTSSGFGFGQFVPGFDFLQKLAQPAAPSAGSGMPNLGSWVAPTFNVEDLEKRIAELKAVHFWLEQNSKALAATIQAMEVQKMTLATLRDLNVNFGDIGKASEAAAESMAKGFAGLEPVAPTQPAAAPEPPVEPVEPAPAEEPQAEEGDRTGGDTIDPVQWWSALQQQFQTIAANAMQELAKHEVPSSNPRPARSKPAAKSTAQSAKARPAAKKTAATRKPAAKKKAPVRSRSSR